MVNINTLYRGVRYAKQEIQENGDNPVWWSNRVNDRINGPIQRRLDDDGINLMAADWDILVVIDACRADLFEKTVSTDRFDDYWRVTSQGSATAEWGRRNFPEEYGDTVYITGNPVPSRHIKGEFHDYIEVWREGFDDNIGTIAADTVTKRALDAADQYPDKRLIVHYMQPHYPFVRDTRFKFEYWNNTDGVSMEGDDRARDVWDAIGLGIVDADEVWEAYRDNLEYVMEEVDELVEAVRGKAVIHSDHGNLLGERSYPVPVRTYGHPSGLRLSSLITVPWAIIDDERRSVVDDGVNATPETTDDMEEQLRALGYRD